MNFKYSSFISYRQNDGDNKFLRNFKKIIESEAYKVTNIKEVFFDDLSIGLGREFDEEIYKSIVDSYFFIPIYHIGYLHVDNVWCARELYHAIEVEKAIRSAVGDEYCYILPIIYRGKLNTLPCCINAKKAKEIRRLEATIISNKTTERLTDFKHFLYETFTSSAELLMNKKIDLNELCAGIKKPTDEEIRKWIKKQKENDKKAEAANLPILNKNAE